VETTGKAKLIQAWGCNTQYFHTWANQRRRINKIQKAQMVMNGSNQVKSLKFSYTIIRSCLIRWVHKKLRLA
jgi:hypothetical protein